MLDALHWRPATALLPDTVPHACPFGSRYFRRAHRRGVALGSDRLRDPARSGGLRVVSGRPPQPVRRRSLHGVLGTSRRRLEVPALRERRARLRGRAGTAHACAEKAEGSYTYSLTYCVVAFGIEACNFKAPAADVTVTVTGS